MKKYRIDWDSYFYAKWIYKYFYLVQGFLAGTTILAPRFGKMADTRRSDPRIFFF